MTQPTKFLKGNLAVVDPPPSYTHGLPEILAIWSEPPAAKGPRVIGHLNKNDIILIIDIRNMDQHTQYSKIFSAPYGTIGWANSKFLRMVQQ
jgi:hypothetical protein